MGQNAPVGDPPVPPAPAPPAPPAPPPPDPELARLQTENAAQARQLALAQARLDFPNSDAETLGMFQGTVDDLRKLAERLHTKESERMAALSHGPGPAPTPGPGGAPSAGDVALARYNELRPKIQGRYAEPHEVIEFEKLAYQKVWNQHMQDRKDGRSSSDGVRY